MSRICTCFYAVQGELLLFTDAWLKRIRQSEPVQYRFALRNGGSFVEWHEGGAVKMLSMQDRKTSR
ncbi:MAG: hypothetical protein CFE43_16940 [Burkholderiales bacterium PBB3]|nr:MAG: hypothetical protein CFE43_16940 [Burkholderiales bacterium PBB3]